jgi:hypothetical protein
MRRHHGSEQTWTSCILAMGYSAFTMDANIRILMVAKDGEDGLIVKFSDGTLGGYVVEELLELRPCREPIEESVDSNKPTTIVRHHRAHLI